ncbi:MAG: hypothetical protein M0Z29_09880 [Actinomycetota bacterium]|nr:hypothetical protein [Actinomycetota bacterium]
MHPLRSADSASGPIPASPRPWAVFWLLEPDSPADRLERKAVAGTLARWRAAGFSVVVVVEAARDVHAGELGLEGAEILQDSEGLVAARYGVAREGGAPYTSRAKRAFVAVGTNGEILKRAFLYQVENEIAELADELCPAPAQDSG